jgi:hypothetical protein
LQVAKSETQRREQENGKSAKTIVQRENQENGKNGGHYIFFSFFPVPSLILSGAGAGDGAQCPVFSLIHACRVQQEQSVKKRSSTRDERPATDDGRRGK